MPYAFGPAVEIDERWTEVDYGSYEGEKLTDVPSEVWREWRTDPEFRPPGGESLAELGVRIRAACDELFGCQFGAGSFMPCEYQNSKKSISGGQYGPKPQNAGHMSPSAAWGTLIRASMYLFGTR